MLKTFYEKKIKKLMKKILILPEDSRQFKIPIEKKKK